MSCVLQRTETHRGGNDERNVTKSDTLFGLATLKLNDKRLFRVHRRNPMSEATGFELLGSAKIVFETDDVVFAEISASLDFDED